MALYNPTEVDCTDGTCDSVVKWFEDDGDTSNDEDIGSTIRAMFTGQLVGSSGKKHIKVEPGTKATAATTTDDANVVCMCDPFPHPEQRKQSLMGSFQQ